jgi:anti-sigma factor ChrR (cupin superfamily)
MSILVHPDFSQRVTVTADEHRWVSSPQAGVTRMMLDRLGGEQARATSLVRYAPASVFPPHGHPGGEEILVLSGIFSDNALTLRVDTREPSAWVRDGLHEVCPLHHTDHEQVSLLRLPPGHAWQLEPRGGAELLVLEGEVMENATALGPLSWLRLPPGDGLEFRAGSCGVTIYLKTGHLAGLAT